MTKYNYFTMIKIQYLSQQQQTIYACRCVQHVQIHSSLIHLTTKIFIVRNYNRIVKTIFRLLRLGFKTFIIFKS